MIEAFKNAMIVASIIGADHRATGDADSSAFRVHPISLSIALQTESWIRSAVGALYVKLT